VYFKGLRPDPLKSKAMTAFHVLIPCAGNGSRAGTAQPKQYQMLAGQPMVMHTLQALARVPGLVSGWVIVSPGDDFVWPKAHWPDRFCRSNCGGASRAESVFNGLSAMLAAGVPAHDWVLVHDAARCLVQPEEVTALVQACSEDDVGGLLALPLPDTLKTEQPGNAPARVDSTVPRAGKWLAQTPQMFRLGALHAALAQVAETGFAGITDEASAMERLGLSPRLVAGSAQNFKVTYPADFALAEAILRSRA
jgi:2-C-methyl-D-erythritol 4-phosphate cytidylyltransferase